MITGEYNFYMHPTDNAQVASVSKNEARGRVVRYVVAGGISALVNLAVLFVLTEYLHMWYVLSSIIAVCVAWVVSFLLQKFWAFRERSFDMLHIQFALHAILSVANIVLNAVLLYAIVEWVGLWYMAAQVVASGILACMNYFVYKRYIFPSGKNV